MAENDVPCGPILDVGQLVNHPQVAHRELIGEVNGNGLTAPMRPVKYESFEQEVRLAPPLLGEDTLAVLKRFDCLDSSLDSDALSQMARDGVIQDPVLSPNAASQA